MFGRYSCFIHRGPSLVLNDIEQNDMYRTLIQYMTVSNCKAVLHHPKNVMHPSDFMNFSFISERVKNYWNSILLEKRMQNFICLT